MINFMKKAHKKEEILQVLNPIVKKWFFSRFKEFSLPQLYGVMEIHNKNNILVSAPSGGTKTLSSFLSIINELVNLAENNLLEDKIYCVYCSPLKSLNRDIEKNLKEPLDEIKKIAKNQGEEIDIRVAVRTGDTTQAEKSRMLKKSCHILITTPETLAILLSSYRFIEHLRDVQWFIMDECLPYNTEITLLGNKKINIGYLVEKNLEGKKYNSTPKQEIKVKSYDFKTNKIVEKRVTNVQKIPTIKKNIGLITKNQLVDIESTEDHKFAILKNNKITWVLSKNIRPGDKLIINIPNYFEGDIQDKKKNGLIIDEKKFKEEYLKIFPLRGKYSKNKLKSLDKAVRNFKKLRVLPLKHNSNKLNIISKIAGHLFGDGWLTRTNSRYNLGFSGDKGDLLELEQDLKKVGGKFHTLTTKKTKSEIQHIKYKHYVFGTSTQAVCYTKHLVFIMELLGIPKGDKTITNYILPKWIMDANKEVKRNFLASFLGSEGVKPRIVKGKRYFDSPRLIFHKGQDNIDNGKIFAKQLINLFKEFKIKVTSLKIEKANIRKNGVTTYKFILTFSKNEENLLRLYKNIGFDYCKRKQDLVHKPILYLKAKLFCKENRKKLINKVRKLRSRKIPYIDIMNNLGLKDLAKTRKHPEKLIYDLCKKYRPDALPKSFPKYREFFKKYVYRGLILDEVRTKKCSKQHRFVYDLTIQDTHNFFANNILVHNCHALADNKRGVHLSLSLERLQNLTGNLTRIGLSATISPLLDMAKFLVGVDRDCKIADVRFIKKMDLKVISPVPDLINVTQAKLHNSLYNLLDNLIQEHRTTLIFTNTRSGTERVVHHLKDKFPKKYIENIGAHHGSLSKKHRHNIEDRLKKGELRCVVTSTALELGIDIGYIDLVILLGSPKSIARGLQRVARSGHKLHDTVKGRIIVLDRDDLVECSVLSKNAIERKIDRIHIPENCLDVLAQQIDGMAVQEKWHIDELFDLIKKSYCYRNLSKEDFMEIIEYLSGEYVSLEERNIYAKIWYDRETGMIGRRGKLGRVIYMTNIGTIPDETAVLVKMGDQLIGTIDEAFLERLRKGDVFTLGGSTYEFNFSSGMVAQVKASVNRPPTIPSWFSEMLPLSFDLALEIQKFRRYMEDLFVNKKSKEEILKFINDYLYIDENAGNAIYEYFKEQFLYAREIPNDKKLLIEFYQEENRKYVIFHSLYGRRVNDVLSRAVAYAIARLQHRDVEIGINDNGFYLASKKNIQALRAFNLLKPKELREVMKKAIERTEVLKRRFRHCATRALMILRKYKGRKKRVGRQQVSSMILMNAVKRISPDFSILKEARREVLEDLMDIENAIGILEQIRNGKVEIKQISTTIPSPFAFNLVTQGYADILKMEDKVEFIRRMHQMVLAKIGKRN